MAGFFRNLLGKPKKDSSSKKQEHAQALKKNGQIPPSADTEMPKAEVPSQEAAQVTPEESAARAANREMMRREQEDRVRAANQEMMRREQENQARQARQANQEMMRREQEDRARAANREMMRREQEDKDTAEMASFANQWMMEHEAMARDKEIEGKRTEFENYYSMAVGNFKMAKTSGEKVAGSSISHSENVRKEMEQARTAFQIAEASVQPMKKKYSILKYDQTYFYNAKMSVLDKMNEETGRVLAKADKKVQKYTKFREQIEQEAKNPRLIKLMKKVAALSVQPAAQQGAGGNQGAGGSQGAGGLQATPPPRQLEEEEKNRVKLEEFYSEHVDTWVSAAEDINGITFDSLDYRRIEGDKVDKASKGTGGIYSLFGALVSLLSGWNAFAKMHKKDVDRKGRGEEKDAETLWQDAREGLEKAVDTISSTLGSVGNFLATGPAAILGIISNCAVLLVKFISVADSGARIRGVNKRKEKIWNRIKEKEEKYKNDKNASEEEREAYSLGRPFRKAKYIKKKRDKLREQLADADKYRLKEDQDRQIAGVAIAEKENLAPDKKYRDIKVSYGSSYTSLSDKIVEEKTWGKGKEFAEKPQEKKKYKTRVRLMEALELFEQYYQEDEAQNRQIKILGHSIEDSVTESLDMIANLAELTTIGASVGKIIKIATGCYSVVRGAITFGVNKVREKMGHANDKEFRRNEMAENMYEAVKGITTGGYGWKSDGSFELDEVQNYKVESAASRMRHVRGMMSGLDVHLDPLLIAPDKAAFIESLSSAFSEDGNG